MSHSIAKSITVGIVAGFVASWIKAKVEKPLQKFGEEMVPPTYEELALKGADVTNHPENMPPAVLANKVNVDYSGEELTKPEKLKAMTYIHYGMGVAVSVVYVLAADRNKNLTFDGGITAGAVIWTMTHGTIIPALGLQGKVSKMPVSWYVWELGSHLVFGVALEQSRVLLNKILD